MKKIVLLVAAVCLATTLIGCSKKKNDDLSSMEGLNGVTSENVISIVDAETNEMQVDSAMEVPVVVDNADSFGMETFNEVEQVASDVEAAASGKPQTKQIQQALKNAGFYNGKVDGDIGPRTKKAIEAFQAHSGLKADGKVGPRTWKVLSEYLNRASEVVNPTEDIQSVGQ